MSGENGEGGYAICEGCGEEMVPGGSCRDFGGVEGGYIPYGQETWNRDMAACGILRASCYDCNVRIGGLHHDGCANEACSSCGGRLLMCDCGGEVGEEV